MSSRKGTRRLAKSLFQQSFTNGRLDPERIKANARSVAQDKPGHFLAISKEYHRLIRLEVERRHAVIESVAPLDPRTTDQLTATLRARYGGDLTIEFRVSPDLIGGLRIKVGSDVWDGSVRGRLARLEQNLVSA